MLAIQIAQAALLLAFPSGALWAVRRFPRALGWLGPVVLCYLCGLLMANLPGVPVQKNVSLSVSEAMVPLAIPLLLFSLDLRRALRLARSSLVSFALACVAVVLTALAWGRFFAPYNDESWKIAGMLVGVYTGGTPNLSAIGLAVQVREETFILLNAADVVLGGAYFFFLVSLAQRLLLLFLPRFRSSGGDAEEAAAAAGSGWRSRAGSMGIALAVSAAIAALSAGATWLALRELSVPVLLLAITTLGIAGSFVPALHRLEGSYALGEYLLLVFCVAIGSLANIKSLLGSSPVLFYETAAVMLSAIAVHYALAAMFRIDADTAIMTSTAAIFGPAFAGPVAQALRNREMVVVGLTTGLVGYAVGNYLGLMVAYALRP